MASNNQKECIIRGYINQDIIDKRITFLHDLSFDFHQDTKMIQFVSALSEAKAEAVKKENYLLAKELKSVLNNAKQVLYPALKARQVFEFPRFKLKRKSIFKKKITMKLKDVK